MSYLVLARKYRPQSFEDLVGQGHVARTLANAIAQDRVAHAFLFTGVRGVGKTTSARLLAKCLNCLGADGQAKGPTATPCQVCSACQEIAKGVDMDVQEIDAASYNGIDEVRRLQEGMGFRPARDRTKIYIVDEVHMLSNAAWNAFLKTLEEPPPHVKFIFATTEVHKVPVTILSRCQRYDFKLIPTQIVHARLTDVLSREGLEAEPKALSILAREAAGSMRDAMSLLDQVLAYGDAVLTEETVTRVLGVASHAVLYELSRAVVSGDAPRALDVLLRVAEQGFDLVHFARDFLHHLRDLVVARTNDGADDTSWTRLLDLSDEEREDVCTIARGASLDDLVRLYQGFSRSFDEIAKSAYPRAAFEVTLVRLTRRAALLPIDELLVRLGELERRLSGGAPPPSPGGGGGGGGGAPKPRREAPRFDPASSLDTESPAPRGPRAVLDEPRPAAAEAVREGNVVPHPTALRAEPRAEAAPPEFPWPGEAPREEPEPRATRPPARVLRMPQAAARRTEAVDFSSFMPADFAEEPTEAQGLELVPQPHTPIVARHVRADAALVATVRGFVSVIREENAALAAYLEHGGPLEATSERIVLAYETDSFAVVQLGLEEHAPVLARAAVKVLGEACTFVLDTETPPEQIPMSIAALDAEARRIALEKAREAVREHPLVKKAIALFDAELRDVRLPQAADN
ncbi:MAG: DNA polymerase III subunit gamma/tau [Myxococcales bacterium]|nr:DNA polymerase III subunit gamma/tau [Myxococcales bacterium]